MKILSWNIYFDDDSGVIRYPRIIEAIEKLDCEFVCLQEVTPAFIRLLEDSCLKKSYKFFHLNQEQSYRCIILSRIEIRDQGILTLPSNLKRVAPYVVVEHCDCELQLFCVHLESMLEDTELRIRQLKHIHSLAKRDFVICGDFNFGDDDLENSYICENFIDFGQSDKSFTFDIDRNQMAFENKFEKEGSRRLDRFIAKGKIRSKSYQVVEELSSDHFPIVCELEF
ncbi:endonuclease/exonuclease/phosphatase family protein [Bacteriovorax sp. DB6_IX]|uniref:endonuclease/exonuclease/phosphatase family protein n=1 Tax=Bacteriovorax sp. DB6_IX TaxID=1353530 RepID=UPI000389DF0A|nr:endonuclease/exonuclease/phosphatase family protein [Bacteriovorax sp. DB6_IX]EQC43173.1 endonuclease/exonuclease/phosphatase family protein [Bacteriovorax sp. DB6_IX]